MGTLLGLGFKGKGGTEHMGTPGPKMSHNRNLIQKWFTKTHQTELHRAAPVWEWPPSSAQVSGGSRRRCSIFRPRRPTVVLKECFQELRGITRHVLPSTSTSTEVACRFFHPKTGYYQQEYGSIFGRPDANPKKSR